MLPRRRAAIRTHSSASASSLSATIRPSATWQTVIRSRNLGRNLYGLEYSRSVLGAYALIREQDGHVHSIFVARGRDSARCACGEPQHAGVARQDLRDKSAHAAAHCIFLQARLQCGSQTGSLKLRRYHKGHLSEIGRRAQEVAGAANDLLVLARSSDGEESDLGLV